MSDRVLIALMMEALRTSETVVEIYQSTRRYNPEEDSFIPPSPSLYTGGCEIITFMLQK
jgi:hypothetical protein